VLPGTPFDAHLSGDTFVFKAPGDDLLCSTVAGYQVAQSDDRITGANFDAAEPIAGAPTPAAPGTSQSFALPIGHKAFVAVRAVDEQGNVGPVAVVSAEPYPRPVGASPMRIPFVPAFTSCNSGQANASHAGPLTGPSCSPPVPSSSLVAVGSKSLSFVRLRVLGQAECAPFDPGACYPDVVVTGSATDIRSGTPTGADYNPSDTNGQDLILSATYPGAASGEGVQITDLANRHDSDTEFNQPGTVVPLPFPVPINCTATADPTVGSGCSVQTTFNSLVPGAAATGNRAVWEIGQLQIFDRGADDAPGSADDRLFAVQGVFIP
jgi:hypothetical protein